MNCDCEKGFFINSIKVFFYIVIIDFLNDLRKFILNVIKEMELISVC